MISGQKPLTFHFKPSNLFDEGSFSMSGRVCGGVYLSSTHKWIKLESSLLQV